MRWPFASEVARFTSKWVPGSSPMDRWTYLGQAALLADSRLPSTRFCSLILALHLPTASPPRGRGSRIFLDLSFYF